MNPETTYMFDIKEGSKDPGTPLVLFPPKFWYNGNQKFELDEIADDKKFVVKDDIKSSFLVKSSVTKK